MWHCVSLDPVSAAQDYNLLKVGLGNMVMTEQMGIQNVSLKVGVCSIDVCALQVAQLVLERQAEKGPLLMDGIRMLAVTVGMWTKDSCEGS